MENNNETNQTQGLTNPQDALNAALIFARALSLILDEDQGIVVDLKGNIEVKDGVQKVIVFKHLDQIHIYNCEENLQEGTAVKMGDSSSESQ